MERQLNQTTLENAKSLGQRLGLSKRQIFRLNASGKIPTPVRIGGSIRWDSKTIESWIAMGCPDRQEFEARRGGAA